MSQSSAVQAEQTPKWKQEVSQRLAAHKSHKGTPAAERQSPSQSHAAGRRAADAAARVAARFAKAPSYSQVLADEARAAVRAAEAASQAALHAQAAAESVLASLEADMQTEYEAKPGVQEVGLFPESEEAVLQSPAKPDTKGAESDFYSIQWESELPKNRTSPSSMRAIHGTDESVAPDQSLLQVDNWPNQDDDPRALGSIQIVEAAQPIHANLIEFPRELVATRKVRPRLAEGPYASASEPGGQLSIFEVDPGTISTLPAPAESPTPVVEPSWTGPEWSAIQLDEQPAEELQEEPELPVAAAPAVELASFSRRLMAVVVDGSLIAGSFLAAAVTAASYAKGLPAPRVAELLAAVALVVVAALYKLLFYTLAAATPGMRYAGLTLAAFTGQSATRAQRCHRLGALLLSLLPVGLGMVWSLFDDQHLCWHDRLSRTYLRRG